MYVLLKNTLLGASRHGLEGIEDYFENWCDFIDVAGVWQNWGPNRKKKTSQNLLDRNTLFFYFYKSCLFERVS